MAHKKGVDISRYQPTVNYQKMKNSEYGDFAIIKCGGGDDGLYEDSKFKQHYDGFKSTNTPLGVYYFGNAGTIARAKQEGEHCVQILKQYNCSFELPVFYDVEGKTLITGNAIARVEAFLKAVIDGGYPNVGIYGNFGQNFGPGGCIEGIDTKKYPIWLAWYGEWPPPEHYCANFDLNDVSIWQFDAEYTEAVGGPTDVNELFDDSLLTNGGKKKEIIYYFYHPLGDNAENAVITTYDNHNALDISIKSSSNASTKGQPIYSMTDGIVVSFNEGYSSSAGTALLVKTSGTTYEKKTGKPLYIKYLHMQYPKEQDSSGDETPNYRTWSVGDKVERGTIIGGMGNTGNTGGFYHLHLEFQNEDGSRPILIQENDSIKIIDKKKYENASIPYDPTSPGGPEYVKQGNNWIYQDLLFVQNPKKVNG